MKKRRARFWCCQVCEGGGRRDSVGESVKISGGGIEFLPGIGYNDIDKSQVGGVLWVSI